MRSQGGTAWRHGMDPVRTEAWGSLDSMAIVMPAPSVYDEFSPVHLKTPLRLSPDKTVAASNLPAAKPALVIGILLSVRA